MLLIKFRLWEIKLTIIKTSEFVNYVKYSKVKILNDRIMQKTAGLCTKYEKYNKQVKE